MEVTIDNELYQQAQSYAQQQGTSIASVIERFLLRFVGRHKAADEQNVPDIVLSLVGAGEPVDEDEIDGRKAYYEYLKEKHHP